MVNIKIKIKAKEIINLKLTDHFKYNEDSEFFDDMAIYEEAFDYILLDAPAGIDRGLQLAVSVADRAIVVSTPDLVCVRSACIAGREIERLGVDDIRLVINRVSKKDIVRGRLLNFDSVIDSTQIQLIGIVPEDPKIRLGSMGRTIYKKGQVSYKALTNIAKRIAGKNAALKV